MSAPVDQPARDRFSNEHDQNFSVIASAGSGKTLSITQRIVAMAKSSRALDLLPTLVVVTFTNHAADEMQQRAREQMFTAKVRPEVMAAFDRAFFGTIHSFAVKLLAQHGQFLGLPAHVDLITDDEDLWNDFVQRQTAVGRTISPDIRAALLRHVQVRDLMELGRRGDLPVVADPIPPCPKIDLRELWSFDPARGSSGFSSYQEELREWEIAFREGDGFLPIPKYTGNVKGFLELWREKFARLQEWLTRAALAVGSETERAYRDYRIERGTISYADQIALAVNLFDQPETAHRIRETNYRVILDEAQDTDPRQFELLLESTRPPQATGRWLATRTAHPRPGYFCMVGDPQQSIYSGRADLPFYRKIRETLVETSAGEELTFSVTFRLDAKQIAFINESFPSLLNNENGQVNFVELHARPDVLPGQMIRLEIAPQNIEPGPNGKFSWHRIALEEARQLAQWLKQMGTGRLRANSWSDVAILCPRKAWFALLRTALRQVGLEVEIHSEDQTKGDNPAHAWLAALTTIMTDPRCGYEIVGVLREVFGLSDDHLASFSQGHGERFQIESETAGDHDVARQLNLLWHCYRFINGQPLFTAVRRIVSEVNLFERLHVLPPEDHGDLKTELHALLVAAAEAETEGETLEDFARTLRDNFATERESQRPPREAIQIITAHKAKGSEWQAVIMPFLAHEVYPPPRRYPYLVKNPRTGQISVALGKQDVEGETEEAIKEDGRLEAERLMYVALTRAKHTLVLAVDSELFAKHGKIAKNSQLIWLRCDSGGCNEQILESLTNQPSGCEATLERQKSQSGAISTDHLPALPRVAEKAFADAKTYAACFVHRSKPSLLVRERDYIAATGADRLKEGDPETWPVLVDNPATRYGIWWHCFAQNLPWNGAKPAQNEVFETCQVSSPDAARSIREWDLLREHVSSESYFGRPFAKATGVVHAEMPFLWRSDGVTCFEGVIDLAFFDRAASHWFLLDWKTNQIRRQQIGDLRDHYRPQLAAYWKAIKTITGMPVEAALFSTATGVLLHYEKSDLEEAWRQLAAAAPREQAVQLNLL